VINIGLIRLYSISQRKFDLLIVLLMRSIFYVKGGGNYFFVH